VFSVSPAVVHRHGQVVVLVEDDPGLRAALERVLSASELKVPCL
jgi:hypothetical protein